MKIMKKFIGNINKFLSNKIIVTSMVIIQPHKINYNNKI
jgi:hypothetical protein